LLFGQLTFGAISVSLLFGDIINGFSLGNDNRYNEFQSDSSANDNTANAANSNLQTIINNKLAALKLPWTLNECVRTHLTCAMGVVSEVNGCRQLHALVF
jgi:hypothetical protein